MDKEGYERALLITERLMDVINSDDDPLSWVLTDYVNMIEKYEDSLPEVIKFKSEIK